MLQVESLKKAFPALQAAGDTQFAVNGVSLKAEAGQFVTLLGPSGCGKTTTLRSIAGLELPESGRITVGGRAVFDSKSKINIAPNRRGLGMMFQSYGIWPHMTVYENAAFPLKIMPRGQRPAPEELRKRVNAVLAIAQMEQYSDRPATALSGGQQQRLALARALVLEPPLLLLDEPLSNLDARLRDTMRVELSRLQKDLGITTLYVTHDQVEALAMSDVIVVMNKGLIEQVGPPREIYERPASAFVASFIGRQQLPFGSHCRRRPRWDYRRRHIFGPP